MALPSDLPQLSSVQRRCLRVVSEFSDLAHAARRLHWSQATLKEMLSDIMASLGAQHIHVDADRVHISETLKSVIEHPQPPRRPAKGALRSETTRPAALELPCRQAARRA